MLDCRNRFYETEWLMRLMRLLNPIAARWQINLRLTLKLTAKKIRGHRKLLALNFSSGIGT